MRFHVLGIPHTATNKEFVACAYTQKALKFCKMMTERGHDVIHYGHEFSEVEGEHVTVLSNKDYEIAYGDFDYHKKFFKYDLEDYAYTTFFANAIREVGKRKQINDFILPFWGHGTRAICDAHPDLIVVEPGIGYPSGQWARFRIYESYTMRAHSMGIEPVAQCVEDWYYTVIPNYFDVNDFEYKNELQKENYFLYLGRIYEGKGVDIALEVTQKLGKKLILAGQGSLKEMGILNDRYPLAEEIGYADTEKRKMHMANAQALIIASKYAEPFGGVQIEAMLSGTPVISPDWGAFAEYNINGYTGYRCRTFADFVEAGERISLGEISSKNCRKWGENFSLEKVGEMYDKYFHDVLQVFVGKGWYSMTPFVDKRTGEQLNRLDQKSFILPDVHPLSATPSPRSDPNPTFEFMSAKSDDNISVYEDARITFSGDPVPPLVSSKSAVRVELVANVADIVKNREKMAESTSITEVYPSDHDHDLGWEKSWWGKCTNTIEEDVKQFTYAAKMGLDIHKKYGHIILPTWANRIVDIGGGPSSMLLKCPTLVEGLVVDPIKYPDWTLERYRSVNINVDVAYGEDFSGTGWDEVWIYNCLQHTKDPEKIIYNALKAAPILRIFEWVNTPATPGHPQTLIASELNKWIGNKGYVENFNDHDTTFYGPAYYGVFRR